MQWLSGQSLSQEWRHSIRQTLSTHQHQPKLVIITIGDDEASAIYVGVKKRACQDVGIECLIHHQTDSTTDACIELIEGYNKDQNVHGILVQLPLPSHLDSEAILTAVDLNKDVDGLSSKQPRYLPSFVPCTPMAIQHLLHHYHIPLKSQHVVVVGTSKLIGRPLVDFFIDQGATLTLCHQWTQQQPPRNDLRTCIERADIVISATGHRDIIQPQWIKQSCVVIDVGIHRHQGHICGDLDHDALGHVQWLTPVPGGVGPVTVTCLLANVTKAFEQVSLVAK